MGCVPGVAVPDDRVFHRICERLEIQVRLVADLRRATHYRVGGTLVLLLPADWARVGRGAEAMIAHQFGLAAIERLGEDAFVAALGGLIIDGRVPAWLAAAAD